jgi:phosphoesterase RecJ-like protein
MFSEEFLSSLENKKNILIISHRGPDGDTLGSAAATAFFLESLEKKVSLFCIHEIPPLLSFINFEKFILKNNPEELNLKKFDLIITVDCADLPQTGLSEKLLQIKNQIPLINIDHHSTNPHYGDINIIDPRASATAEIIYNLFKKINIKFTKEITTALMTGILTDTTYFSNGATTEKAVSAAADLLSQGAKLRQVIQNTWCKHSPESLKLWGKILSELQYNPEHKIVTAIVPPEDSLDKSEIFEGLANFLTSLYEADIILVLRQDFDNIIKCSMRTTKTNINVAKLAQKFGGGGHPKAAGFSLPGKIIHTDHGWKIQ